MISQDFIRETLYLENLEVAVHAYLLYKKAIDHGLSVDMTTYNYLVTHLESQIPLKPLGLYTGTVGSYLEIVDEFKDHPLMKWLISYAKHEGNIYIYKEVSTKTYSENTPKISLCLRFNGYIPIPGTNYFLRSIVSRSDTSSGINEIQFGYTKFKELKNIWYGLNCTYEEFGVFDSRNSIMIPDFSFQQFTSFINQQLGTSWEIR